MTGNLWLLLAAGGAVVAVFVALSLLADNYNLNNIKSRTVGDGPARHSPLGHGAGDPQQLCTGAVSSSRLAGG